MLGIILDEKGDFTLAGGIIAIEDADGQSIENRLKANRGEFQEAPLVGGEVQRMQNGTPSPLWCSSVKKQIQSVGLPVTSVTMTVDLITVK